MILAVAAGGALGATLRYLASLQIGAWLGTSFPWHSLLVNWAGCLAMGLLAEAAALSWSPSPEWRTFLTVGLLGGFTTFSAFALDTGLLAGREQTAAALTYVAASVLGCLGFFYLGLRLVRWVAA